MNLIIVIEDDPAIRDTILTLLKLNGYQAEGADNGRTGLKLVRERMPDLVLCDIMMPELDGYGVYHALRANPATAVIPFIFLSARASTTDVRHGMGIGADDYITKPFDHHELLNSVAARIRRREAAVQTVRSIQDSIAHSIPHAFRNPLNGILGFTAILLEDAKAGGHLDRELVEEYAGHIQQAGEALLRAILRQEKYAELRLIVETPAAAAEARAVVCEGWAGAVQKLLAGSQRAAGREELLYLNIALETSVHIRQEHLLLALEELWDNALKFSPPGTCPGLHVDREESLLRFAVIDAAPAFSAAELTQFGAGAHPGISFHSASGTGLGLAMVREISRLYGGRLEIEAIPAGGNRVSLLLPAAV